MNWQSHQIVLANTHFKGNTTTATILAAEVFDNQLQCQWLTVINLEACFPTHLT